VTLAAFILYTQIENHVLNPLVMSKTMRISPLLVLVSILAGYSIGNWTDGLFGGFAAGLLAIPAAGALQILGRQAWRDIARKEKAEFTGMDPDADSDSAAEILHSAGYAGSA
jgi:predicted PurR-regulated permease PerM